MECHTGARPSGPLGLGFQGSFPGLASIDFRHGSRKFKIAAENCGGDLAGPLRAPGLRRITSYIVRVHFRDLYQTRLSSVLHKVALLDTSPQDCRRYGNFVVTTKRLNTAPLSPLETPSGPSLTNWSGFRRLISGGFQKVGGVKHKLEVVLENPRCAQAKRGQFCLMKGERAGVGKLRSAYVGPWLQPGRRGYTPRPNANA